MDEDLENCGDAFSKAYGIISDICRAPPTAIAWLVFLLFQGYGQTRIKKWTVVLFYCSQQPRWKKEQLALLQVFYFHVGLTLSTGLELASITTKEDDSVGCGCSLTWGSIHQLATGMHLPVKTCSSRFQSSTAWNFSAVFMTVFCCTVEHWKHREPIWSNA